MMHRVLENIRSIDKTTLSILDTGLLQNLYFLINDTNGIYNEDISINIAKFKSILATLTSNSKQIAVLIQLIQLNNELINLKNEIDKAWFEATNEKIGGEDFMDLLLMLAPSDLKKEQCQLDIEKLQEIQIIIDTLLGSDAGSYVSLSLHNVFQLKLKEFDIKENSSSTYVCGSGYLRNAVYQFKLNNLKSQCQNYKTYLDSLPIYTQKKMEIVLKFLQLFSEEKLTKEVDCIMTKDNKKSFEKEVKIGLLLKKIVETIDLHKETIEEIKSTTNHRASFNWVRDMVNSKFKAQEKLFLDSLEELYQKPKKYDLQHSTPRQSQ